MGRARAAAIVATASALALAPACGSLEPTNASSGVADAAPGDGAPRATNDAGADADTSAYRTVVLSDMPVLYYRLGERADATVAVDEVAGRNATYDVAKGGAVGAIAGDPDTAATFDGMTSRVVVLAPDMPEFTGNMPFSLEAWVKPRVAQPTFAHLITKESSPAGQRAGYALIVDENGGFKLERFVANANTFALDGTLPPVDTYTYVVGTYDGQMLSLFVNGDRVNQAADTRAMTAQPGVEGVIGRSSGSSLYTFDGAIDEVAVYDHALPPARVKAHYDAGKAKP